MENKDTVLTKKHVCPYQMNYFYHPWYERDLMRYYNWLDYKKMTDNPDHYMKNSKVVNFDIIHHECRSDPLKKSYDEHISIQKRDFLEHPKEDKKILSLQVVETKKNGRWIKRDLIIEHFKIIGLFCILIFNFLYIAIIII